MSRRTRRPILIAHRGDPKHSPENTVTSFRSALARGAKRIEMDVRRCTDGTWVVFHNPIRRWRKGVPTLEQALAWCRQQRLPIYLDVKEATREKELLELLRQSGWLGQITLLAGSVPSLRRWRRLLPLAHPLYWVTGYRESLTHGRLEIARQLHLQGFAAYQHRISPSSLIRIHRAGFKLIVWTARSAQEIRRLCRLGVDGIMSEVWPPPLSI